MGLQRLTGRRSPGCSTSHYAGSGDTCLMDVIHICMCLWEKKKKDVDLIHPILIHCFMFCWNSVLWIPWWWCFILPNEMNGDFCDLIAAYARSGYKSLIVSSLLSTTYLHRTAAYFWHIQCQPYQVYIMFKFPTSSAANALSLHYESSF